ncbi:MAG: Gfo/Idh/MocA family oxidoreductase, partial [Acidimicrobiia bacterium]|nr:Gfo/Idh/MocA family oxidoreductase [Acidimicrobiia bacterium]
EGVFVKSAADRDALRRDHIEHLYPTLNVLDDAASIISDPDIHAVVIATNPSSHFELTREALRIGKHVLVEKPLATSVSDSEELKRLAAEMGLTLMVGHTFVYTAAVNRIADLVRLGELGEMMYVRSLRVNLGVFQRDVNVLWDLAPHDLSILLYVLGRAPLSVSATGKAHVTRGIEDVVNLTLDFGSSLTATILVSWLDPKKVREMTFIGDNKMLVYDDVSPIEKIRIFDKRVEGPRHYDSFGEFQYSYRYGDIVSPMLDDQEPLATQTKHFIDCIRLGKNPRSDAQAGIDVVRILSAAQLSMASAGEAVEMADARISEVNGFPPTAPRS